jgi:hypothetical protein
MATFSTNTTLKVNRPITGATTVAANCYAVVNYKVTAAVPVIGMGSVAAGFGGIVQMYFGPAQSIPASFSAVVGTHSNSNIDGTYTLFNGVEFANTP